MKQEELMALIGLVGGLGGSYLMGERADRKAKDKKKQDILDEIELAKLLREEEKKIREEENYELDTKRFKREGRFTEGDRRGEIKNPGFFDMFGAEYDPVHNFIEDKFGLGAADFFTGTTAYDTSLPMDQRIRNPESEEFVENRSNNFLTDFGILPYTVIPGAGPVAGALAARLGLSGLRKLGPGMMSSLGSFLNRKPTAAAGGPFPPPGPTFSTLLPTYNDGGRVNMDDGGLSFFVDPEMDADGFEIPRDPSEVGMGNMFLEAIGNLVRGAKIENDGYSFPRQPNKIRKGIYDLIGFDASNYPGFDDLTEFYGAED